MEKEITIKELKRSTVKLPGNFELSVWKKITGRSWATRIPWKAALRRASREGVEISWLWSSLPWAVACMALFVGAELGAIKGIDYNSSAKENLSALYSSSVNPMDENPYL